MKPSTSQRYVHVIDRRRAIQLGAGLGVVASRSAFAQSTPVASPVSSGEIPVTGNDVPELSAFGDAVTNTMATWNLPGGQLAIARGDRLVYNRGFGFASVEDEETVAPDALFRIASTSKPFTAVAILALVDSGDLTLDTPVCPLLDFEHPANAPRDPRLDSITVEQLLVHSGGWNSALSYDPQYLPWPLLASHLFDAESPAEAETIIRFMLTQPLDFNPGEISAYSNFGFNVLGRVIEKVSGTPYEDFVKEKLLTPCGITTMAIGGTTLEERMPGEVRYYSPPGLAHRPSVYPGQGFVPVGYGSMYMRSLDAHGGWIASAQDLVRFALAVDGTRGPSLLSPDAITSMETTQRPQTEAAGAGNVPGGFGLGWNTERAGDGYDWSHAGALEGSNCSWLVRKADGSTLGFVFNSLPENYGGFFGDIIPRMQELLSGDIAWPEGDLFA